jgi:hypothetical protein
MPDLMSLRATRPANGMFLLRLVHLAHPTFPEPLDETVVSYHLDAAATHGRPCREERPVWGAR